MHDVHWHKNAHYENNHVILKSILQFVNTLYRVTKMTKMIKKYAII